MSSDFSRDALSPSPVGPRGMRSVRIIELPIGIDRDKPVVGCPGEFNRYSPRAKLRRDTPRLVGERTRRLRPGVPDTHYSGWRRESRGLTSGMALILLSITGTMITEVVLPLRVCDASSIHACLPSPRDRGR